MNISKQWALVLFAGMAGTMVMVGCSKGPVCKDLGSCGGNLVGIWAQRPAAEDTGKYCQEIIHKPPLDEYLRGQPTPVARMRLPESTNADWCHNLVLTSDMTNALKKNLYYWENLPYEGGLLTYEDNGDYSLDFGRTGRVSLYYSRTCLSQYGHDTNCAKLQQRLIEANDGAGEYDFFDCQDDAAKGGCNCSFQVGEADAQSGVFSISGGMVTHFSNTPITRFTPASYCVNGDTLELSGIDNSYLWDRPGLRTVEMVRVNCGDGRQGPGEGGVDCGGRCPNACPQTAP
jgi:hypothetical protein